eukprot:TRINITY_DN63941_c0_g1_i1.p1 TRINITY_DN63941_c0_g1~~TRINITY_DN63941_c0_g1_i1.p1  ORF type:complete len:882 (+),score=83.16 TRINITY_DN63941_c0_g1_i1:33-2648(+)
MAMDAPMVDTFHANDYRSLSLQIHEIYEGQRRLEQMLKNWMDHEAQRAPKSENDLLGDRDAFSPALHAEASLPPLHVCFSQPSDIEEHFPSAKRIRSTCSRAVTLKSSSNETFFLIHRFAIHPNSNKRVFIDLIGIIFLAYDMVMIPLILTWTVPMGIFQYLNVLFWCFDMCCSFLTGYMAGNVVEMRFTHIARRYLKSWFIVDAGLLALDIVDVALENGTDGRHRLLRLVRLGRVIRVLSLFRSGRIARVIDEFEYRLNCDVHRCALQFTTFIFFLLWVTHVLSCMWFAVGAYADSNTGERWVNLAMQENGSSLTYKEASIFYQYIASAHWAAAQITLGSTDIVCHNSAERLLSLLCLFFGLFFTSSLISSISANLVDIQMANKKARDNMRILREYVRQNNISGRLARHVQQQFALHSSTKRRLTEADVTALNGLSRFLRKSLAFEALKPSLLSNSFLRALTYLNDACVRDLCAESITTTLSHENDEIFNIAKEARYVYYVMEGSLTYKEDDVVPEVTVCQAAWISEAAMFVTWIHVGSLTSSTACLLLVVDACKWLSTLESHLLTFSFAKEYARQFYHRVEAAALQLTDLELQGATFEDVIVHTSSHARATVSMSVFDLCRSSASNWFTSRNVHDLKREVFDNKGILTMGADKKPLRIVSIVCIEIVDELDRILVQVGTRSDTRGTDVACRRIGGKQTFGESAEAALDRLLTTTLKHVAALCQNVLYDRVEMTKEKSERYAVVTHYTSTVFRTTLLPGARLQKLQHVEFNHGSSFTPGQLFRQGSTASLSTRLPARRRTSDSDGRVRPDWANNDVVIVNGCNDETILMAWVTRDEYTYLRSSSGKVFLQKHLQNCRALTNDNEQDNFYV